MTIVALQCSMREKLIIMANLALQYSMYWIIVCLDSRSMCSVSRCSVLDQMSLAHIFRKVFSILDQVHY